MCLVKTPSAPAPPPPPQYLHNPYLDGATMGDGQNKGRNSLVTGGVNNYDTVGTAGGTGVNTGPPATTPTPQNPRTGIQMTAPKGGLNMPAGTQANGPVIPVVAGQPGSVVPTVGGVLAGVVQGRVTSPLQPPTGLTKSA